MNDYIFQNVRTAEAEEVENGLKFLSERAEAVMLLLADIILTIVSLKTYKGESVKETETLTLEQAIRKQSANKGVPVASIGSIMRLIRSLPASAKLGIEKGKGIPQLFSEAIAEAKTAEEAELLKAMYKVMTGQAGNTVAGFLGCFAKQGSGHDRQFLNGAVRLAANANASRATLESLGGDVSRVLARYQERPAEKSFFKKKESTASQVARETAKETGTAAAWRNAVSQEEERLRAEVLAGIQAEEAAGALTPKAASLKRKVAEAKGYQAEAEASLRAKEINEAAQVAA